ncbi:DUF1722 domain-containing protein [Macrococcus lamae]|uniref:DUF1722 domain-containing protein n=1 Tax=Macrococcus lamae TaxID=198484 RepID=A0A4R6BXL5_9STAP|nr:DUF1722 domain-containing protein [Macrococcus lamae]TDM12768.1 DUF1722 domain-containing protein [Macrococcus lamae]
MTTERQQLEKYWREEKYLVMYHSQTSYEAIRALLKGQPSYAALDNLINQAKAVTPTTGSKINAYQHIWGYFKKRATAEEKERTFMLLEQLDTAESELTQHLYMLAEKYTVQYLLDSTLFKDNA